VAKGKKYEGGARGLDLNQRTLIRRAGTSPEGMDLGTIAMRTLKWIVTTAPEILLLLCVAIGTILGRFRFKGFALGSTACILIVAVILGQLGTFVIPPLFRSVFFSLFVFTIGYRSGPEFFDALDLDQRSVSPVAKACGQSLRRNPMAVMFRALRLIFASILVLTTPQPCWSADNGTLLRIQEEVWAIPLIHPRIAYVVRPVGNGPFPLAVMNHGVSLNPVDRSFFRWSSSGMRRCGLRAADIWWWRRLARDTGPQHSIRPSMVCLPCSIRRSANARTRISAMPAWRSPCSTNGSSIT